MLEAVMARIKKEVPEFRWIDVNVGQMATENPPVSYPCALVDVPNLCYENLTESGSIQRKELTIEVELYFIVRAPANMSAPEPIRAQGMEHLTLMEDVYRTLQGFEAGDYSPLQCVGITRSKDYYPRSITLTFTCLNEV